MPFVNESDNCVLARRGFDRFIGPREVSRNQLTLPLDVLLSSFGIQRNFKLNKDSQTEIFSLVSAVSNPKEPKTSTNFCILCAVREELTYICRVCLTKVYPLFSDREEFILCFL